MSRLIVLLILAVWLLGAEAVQKPHLVFRPELLVFFAGYAALVAGLGIWARLLVRQAPGPQWHRRLRHYHHAVYFARWLVPAWLLFGLFGGADWAGLVIALTGMKMQLPGILLGTLPPFLAWTALWWAEYPAERAWREQNLLDDLYDNVPVRMPPRFRRHFFTALRQQFLPIVVPVLMILLLRDLILLAAGPRLPAPYTEFAMLPAAVGVYVLSPEILKRIFNARSLDPSPLRSRLEAICRRGGLRYRDILLWQTDFSMANAAVIGILPNWRYVLLSDRLLETMTDEQIEAVFAHELGHIVHHHMLWFVIFFVILTLGALGPGQIVDEWISASLPQTLRSEPYVILHDFIGAAVMFGGMLVLFGMLSRRFERQADVFAARMMDHSAAESASPIASALAAPMARPVGPRGAGIFASALHRVAVVNNIPLRARDWFHPSIAKRIDYLQHLSADPARTTRFDRFMRRLYLALTLALVVCGVLTLV